MKNIVKNIDKNVLIYNDTLNYYGKVCNSWTTCIVLLVIVFLIIIGISSACFYFNWYLKGSDTYVNASTNTNIKIGTTIYSTYKWKIFKKIYLKNHSYYFYNNSINIKKFYLERNLYKNIDIYYIGYVITKCYHNNDADSVCPFYLIFYEIDRSIETKIEINN